LLSANTSSDDGRPAADTPARTPRLRRFMRRRRFIVHPRLQGRLMLASFAHVGIVCGVFAIGLFGPAVIAMFQSDPNSVQALESANQVLYLHVRFWPVVLLAFLLVGLDSVRISHRIAGPMFRFDRVLQRLRERRVPPPIRLRKGDMLHRECGRINTLLVDARRDVMEIQGSRETMDRAIQRLRTAENAIRDPEARRALDDIMVAIEQFAEIVDRFQLDSLESDL
jgi:hypothetical protein